MRTQLITQDELKEIFVEIFLSTQNKVTKVSPHSVMNGVSFGVAAIGQKAMKDIALTEILINPDLAYGSYLDDLAEKWGVSPRFPATGSFTYIYVSADSGTNYTIGDTVSGNAGVSFQIAENFTIPNEGFGYIKVNSVGVGIETNVAPLTLTKINPEPTGHKYLINEDMAIGGMDKESDEHFRQRIKDGANIIANSTLSKLEQIFMRTNPIILKLFYGGVDTNGQNILKVATVNGSSLTSAELQALLDASHEYLSLSDLRIYNGIMTYGVDLRNIDYFPIDISFKVKILSSYSSDEVRKNMQVNLAKYFDYRYFKNKGIIQWDDLFYLCRETEGVEYLADQTFQPSSDFQIPKDTLPRIRSFKMYDLNGVLISDDQGNLDPIFYPNNPDYNTQQTI